MAPLRHSLLCSSILFLTVIPHTIVYEWEPQIQRASCSCSTPEPVKERSAEEIIEKLSLVPNEEEGYYIQTFKDPYDIGHLNRFASMDIYYFLEGSDGDSIRHGVDTVEVWHSYAGPPLLLSLPFDDGQPLRDDIADMCTVAPGSVPDVVKLADPGWAPNTSRV